MLASRGDKRGTLRPVELAELNQSELHIASLVFKKRLSGLFYLSRYLFDGSVFEFGDVRDAHGAGAVRVGVFFWCCGTGTDQVELDKIRIRGEGSGTAGFLRHPRLGQRKKREKGRKEEENGEKEDVSPFCITELPSPQGSHAKGVVLPS